MLDFLIDHSFSTLFLLLVVFPVVYFSISFELEQRAIVRLGALPPRVRAKLPFGIDILLRSIYHVRADKDLENWKWLFSWSPNSRSKTVEAYIGRQRYIFTADPENIKAILATQFNDYGKGKPFLDNWHDFLGDSIFTTDGQSWHNSRQLLRPQFVKQRVADLDLFENHVEKLLSKIGGHGEEVDVSALFYRYTLDTATDYLLGKSVESQDHPDAPFTAAFNEVQRIQNFIGKSPEPFNRMIPRKTFWAGLEVMNGFVEQFIDRALRLNISDLHEKSDQSFLHALAATGTRDRKVIRDQVVAVLLAGRDTTAGTLSFTFQELSANPEIVRKLRREIVEAVGDRKPTYEDLKGMTYLQHVMNETLRLYPSVPYNMRMSLHDTTLPTGGGSDGSEPLGILKDTIVAYSALLMQRREDLYPAPSSDFPAVHIYCPERWEKWTPKSWTYIPFNGGPRICIGQQFALTEMAYTIVRILQRFERVDRYWVAEDMRLKSEIVLSPADGVRVGFWEAKSR